MDLKLKIVFLAILIQNIVLCEDTEIKCPTLNGQVLGNTSSPDNSITGDAVNDFGFKLLLTMMGEDKNKNVVISPTSIAGVLAMTLLGTVGKTYDELADALGFSQDVIENRKNHEQFGDLLLRLNSNQSWSRTLYADAMFVDAGAQLRSLFVDFLDRVYHGDAVNVDFRLGPVVKDRINEWVSSHTQGKIENFLHNPLPEETKVVLLSALYFRGQWLHPFKPEYTTKMNFTTPTNEVIVDQMLNMGSFKYVLADEYGLHMVALPYNDTVTTMYVLKPIFPNRVSLLDLMNPLNYTIIDQLINQMENRKTVIRFPKMDLQSKVKLEDSLKALGVKSLFTQGEANFALMVDGNTVPNKTEIEIIERIKGDDNKEWKELLNGLANPGVHVDSVIHDVKLTINEFGTEAVAATAGILARTAQLFYADSPFYMFIRNEDTKLVTFSAAIFDPTT